MKEISKETLEKMVREAVKDMPTEMLYSMKRAIETELIRRPVIRKLPT